jgi:hypothetical protein
VVLKTALVELHCTALLQVDLTCALIMHVAQLLYSVDGLQLQMHIMRAWACALPNANAHTVRA